MMGGEDKSEESREEERAWDAGKTVGDCRTEEHWDKP